MDDTRRYCRFREGCLHLEEGTQADCLVWREEHPYDNGEEQ